MPEMGVYPICVMKFLSPARATARLGSLILPKDCLRVDTLSTSTFAGEIREEVQTQFTLILSLLSMEILIVKYLQPALTSQSRVSGRTRSAGPEGDGALKVRVRASQESESRCTSSVQLMEADLTHPTYPKCQMYKHHYQPF
ncbi:hypothetical protein J6590_066115 [Homalodisca vitripennis]|nr:hypothetical protein J6590_066115 [Homalodisca vitripennis]